MDRILNDFSFKKYGLLLAGMFMCVYFAYHLTHGPRSIFYLQQLKQDVQLHEIAYEDHLAQGNELEERVVMLRPGSIDKDFLEERVRVMLGYMHNGEMMIPE